LRSSFVSFLGQGHTATADHGYFNYWSDDFDMNRILIGTLLWLAIVFPACGKSTVIPVTPKTINGIDQFKFVVTNGTVSNGMSFHIIVTAKNGWMPTDSRGYLCVANLTQHSNSIGPMTPETQVTLKTGTRTLIADIVASQQFLSNPDACFVFVISDHRGPAADFYVLKLHDFAKQ
jgi:hypothetical protein